MSRQKLSLTREKGRVVTERVRDMTEKGRVVTEIVRDMTEKGRDETE